MTDTADLASQAGYLRDQFAALAAKAPVPLPTPQELAAGAAADKVTAARIHAARPGIPQHTAFNALQALRAVRALDQAPNPDREDRIPLDQLTEDDLAQLYDDLDRYAEVVGELNEANTTMARDLAVLRQVARGYCPACGRGDAAPTVTDWEQQRDKAGRLEIANRALNTAALEAVERAERAEAALARVREYVATSDDDGIHTRETILRIVGDWPGPETEAPSAAETRATERVKHSGPNTAFCVLCLSGEHERVDQEQPDA